jgi:hypothetical protein
MNRVVYIASIIGIDRRIYIASIIDMEIRLFRQYYKHVWRHIIGMDRGIYIAPNIGKTRGNNICSIIGMHIHDCICHTYFRHG